MGNCHGRERLPKSGLLPQSACKFLFALRPPHVALYYQCKSLIILHTMETSTPAAEQEVAFYFFSLPHQTKQQDKTPESRHSANQQNATICSPVLSGMMCSDKQPFFMDSGTGFSPLSPNIGEPFTSPILGSSQGLNRQTVCGPHIYSPQLLVTLSADPLKQAIWRKSKNTLPCSYSNSQQFPHDARSIGGCYQPVIKTILQLPESLL